MSCALLSREGLTFLESHPCLGLHQRAQSPVPAQGARRPRPGRLVTAVTYILPTVSPTEHGGHSDSTVSAPVYVLRKRFPFLKVNRVHLPHGNVRPHSASLLCLFQVGYISGGRGQWLQHRTGLQMCRSHLDAVLG